MAEKKIMITIPEGIAVYPHLLEEDKYQLSEHGKREFNTQVRLIPDENEEHATFLAEIDELCAEAFEEGKLELEAVVANPETKGKAKKAAKEALAELKVHKPYQADVDSDGEDNGAFIVATKCLAGGTYKAGPKQGEDWSKKLPLFDSEGQPIKSREGLVVWGGSRISVSAQVIPFCAEGLKLAGVSLRLQAVQIIEAVGGNGGSADSFGFGVVAGGYKTDNFANASKSSDEGTAPADTSDEDDF